MERLKKIINRGKVPSSKKLGVFSIFLFVSSFLWFFIALGNNYEDTIEVEFQFVNYPEGKGILGELPKRSNIEVESSGYNIFKYRYLSSIPVVKIEIDKCSEQRNNKLTFSNKQVKALINKRLGSDIRILQIDFTRKSYKLSNLATKNVKVIPNINLSFAKQYRISKDIKIIPKEVKVSGYKGVIDTISMVQTELLNIVDLKSNYITKAKLQNLSNLRYNVDSVLISIIVEKFTEKHLKVPVRVINKPKSIKVELFTKEVELLFNIGINNYEDIDINSFKAIIDYNDMIKSNSNFAKVRISKYPKILKKINYYPKEIEFLLERK